MKREDEIEILDVPEFKWNEFRPPLGKLSIKTPKGCNNPNLLSLKYIESLNTHINKQEELVTQNYIPKPINGNCCLDVIDENFQYTNEFMRNKEIRDLYELVNKC